MKGGEKHCFYHCIILSIAEKWFFFSKCTNADFFLMVNIIQFDTHTFQNLMYMYVFRFLFFLHDVDTTVV